MLVLVGPIEHPASLSWDGEHMHPPEVMEDPAGGRVLDAFTFVVWQGGAMLLEGRAETVCEGRIDEQTDRHAHHQGHDPLGLCAIQGRSQKLRGLQEAQPPCRPGLPCVAVEHRLGRSLALVECVRREEKATLLVDACLTVGEPRRQGPDDRGDQVVGLGARAWAPSLPLGGRGADGAGVEHRGLQACGKTRERLLGSGCTGKRGPAQRPEGVDFLGTLRAPLLVHGTLGWRLARLGVDASPAWLEAAIARWPHTIARALRERCPRLGLSRGQDGLGCAQGRGDAGNPLEVGLGQLVQGLGTREGTGSDQERHPRGDLPLGYLGGDALTAVVRVTAMATEGRHQHGDTGVVCDEQLQHHLVAVRALIPTGATGDVQAVLLRLRVTVIPAIDMEAGALERGERWGKPQARGGRSGHAAVECRYPIRLERIQGTATRVIVAMTGVHARSDETRERRMLQKMRPEVELVVDEAQAVADHRLDRMAGGDNPHGRVLLGGVSNDLSDAECFTHPRDSTQGISDLRAVRLGLWRNSRTVRVSHRLLLCRGDCIDTPKLLRGCLETKSMRDNILCYILGKTKNGITRESVSYHAFSNS